MIALSSSPPKVQGPADTITHQASVAEGDAVRTYSRWTNGAITSAHTTYDEEGKAWGDYPRVVVVHFEPSGALQPDGGRLLRLRSHGAPEPTHKLIYLDAGGGFVDVAADESMCGWWPGRVTLTDGRVIEAGQ